MFQGFEPRLVPGLYNLAHYQHANGSFIQVKHGTAGDRIEGSYLDKPRDKRHTFCSRADLAVLLATYHPY